MKSKTASVRLPKDMYEEIDELCDGIGCSRNDWIKDTLQDRLREENSETEDPRPKPTLTKIIQGEVIKPIKLTCKDGELWTQWNSDGVRTKYGNCANFELTNGKVYNNSGELVGVIENQD